MINTVEYQGRLKGSINRVSETSGVHADFVIWNGCEGTRSQTFQVICDSRNAYGIADGDRITITGSLREYGGDAYIWAEKIEPDRQMVLRF